MGDLKIIGTGGIIEGNLGAANVNVNTDSSLYFDATGGTDTRVDMNDVDQTAPFTLSAWIDSRHTASEYILQKDGSWHFYIQPSDHKLRFDTSGLVRGGAGKLAPNTGWHHVAATFDSSGNQAVYIDGVCEATASGMSLTASAGDLSIVANALNASGFTGYIADVKIFNVELDSGTAVGASGPDISKLASKINCDVDVLGISGLQQWYKLNEGSSTTANDSAGSTENGTITNGTWKFDSYGVNVQDTMTTDGAVTITQGKLDCLSLSSIDCDVTTENTIALASQAAETTLQTVACWVTADALSTYKYFLGQSGNNAYGFYSGNASNRSLWVTCGDRFDSDVNLTTGRWYHFATTWDGTTQKIYIDGVFAASKTDTGGGATGDNRMSIATIGGDNDVTFWNGKIRDVRTYDFAFSADQISSLYSGSYNVTPYKWWKLDEGHATAVLANAVGAFSDSGTATAIHGQGDNFTDEGGSAGCVNGTLNLDSTLTIAANGTFNGPRGTFQIDTDITGSGTFTLLSGCTFTLAANKTFTGTSSANQLTVDIPSNLDLELVADVANLHLASGSDLTVVGSVTGCTFADSTANIRQWHHTLDTQQLLDADEKGDDDLKLTKPALDNSHELQTG